MFRNSNITEWRCDKRLLPTNASSSSVYLDESTDKWASLERMDNNLPQYAIAGDTGYNVFEKEYFVSSKENRPWLQLHFDTNVTVHRVAITNRYDHRWGRFQNLTVSVGTIPAKSNALSANPTCAKYPGPSAPSTSIILKCEAPLTGIYLVIQQDTPNSKIAMIINEVYVCGS